MKSTLALILCLLSCNWFGMLIGMSFNNDLPIIFWVLPTGALIAGLFAECAYYIGEDE